MDWFVVRHPETGGVGVVPESALSLHKGLGWIRVSDALTERSKDLVAHASYTDAPDLDADEPAAVLVGEPGPEPDHPAMPDDTPEEQ